MNRQIAHIIGVGPGDHRLIPIASQQLLQDADCVAGFKTVNRIAEAWTRPQTRFIDLTYTDQEEGILAAARLAARGEKVVFTAWGDFNVSGNELVERIEQSCGDCQVPLEYVPGISCLQLAFTRARLSAEESLFITLHRRNGLDAAQKELLKHANENEKHLFIIPHTFDMMPAAIAGFLMENGHDSSRPVTVMERLSCDDECITRGTLQELGENPKEFSDLSIVVLPRTPSNR